MANLKVLIAGEAGTAFREGFAQRLEARRLAVDVVPIGDAPADVAVVGGMRAQDDVRAGLRAGVRWIQSLSTGVETVLIPELLASDVVLTNSAGASAGPVAEFAFARILEHAKRLERIRRQQDARSWDRFFQDSLEGSTLTTVGLGPIGRRVAEMATSFQMHTIAIRRRPEAGAGPCDEVAGPVDLAAVMARSDYVVLAAAVTPETRGMVGERELAAAKDGCLIVNVGRAELLDYPALLACTKDGRISAALDVFATEPLPPDDPLWNATGIAISPHIAVWTPRIVEVLVDLATENVDRFMHGRELINVVDKDLGYAML